MSSFELKSTPGEGTPCADIALAVRYVRRGEPAGVRLLRAVHNGSVNDYAAFLTAGFLTAMVVLWM